MFFPDVDKQILCELAQHNHCQLLVLQAEAECGDHWISFLLFGQNDEHGIPVILLQAVHPLFQRQGIGRWGLHLVYQRCRKARYMLLNTQLGLDLGFYTRVGFAHFQDAKTRFKMIGDTVWRRPLELGAVMDISLSAVVSESHSTQSPATRNHCRWLCPLGAAFKSIPGTDVCFAATMMHMIMSLPQMVQHFSGYPHRPGSIGSLVSGCLAHMWHSRTQEDPDGPILIALLRQRLTVAFCQAFGST
jgi:GNAT superfamily N-acetyltransferase